MILWGSVSATGNKSSDWGEQKIDEWDAHKNSERGHSLSWGSPGDSSLWEYTHWIDLRDGTAADTWKVEPQCSISLFLRISLNITFVLCDVDDWPKGRREDDYVPWPWLLLNAECSCLDAFVIFGCLLIFIFWPLPICSCQHWRTHNLLYSSAPRTVDLFQAQCR